VTVVQFKQPGKSHHTRALLHHLSTTPYALRAYRLFGATAETPRHGFRRRQATLCPQLGSHRARAPRRAPERGKRARHAPRGGTRSSRALGQHLRRIRRGYPGVLPPAEINTRSAGVEGVVVADGAISSNIGWPLDVRLAANPVTLRIANGRITDVDSSHALVRDLVEEFLAVPDCNEVVEIGIGTNDGIPGFVPSDVLLNERVASFHLGVGSADAEKAEQNLHLDFILGACQIHMGDHIVLRKGKFARPTTAAIPDRRRYGVPVKLHDAL
jgi:hypothetical protein